MSRKFSNGPRLSGDSTFAPTISVNLASKVESQSSQNVSDFSTTSKLLVAKQTPKHADLHHELKLRQIPQQDANQLDTKDSQDGPTHTRNLDDNSLSLSCSKVVRGPWLSRNSGGLPRPFSL